MSQGQGQGSRSRFACHAKAAQLRRVPLDKHQSDPEPVFGSKGSATHLTVRKPLAKEARQWRNPVVLRRKAHGLCKVR
jgi:hypothetical protein